MDLEAKFGTRHDFTHYDLFPFVLNDDGRSTSRRCSSTPYQSLGDEILQTFDPNRAGLSTWVMRQVRHHRELRAFLREYGVDLVTDWSLLNETSPEHLQQILAEFYALTATEIELASHLLRAYHEVYRYDRLQMRQLGRLKGKQACPPPTKGQLTRIAHYLQEHFTLTLSPELITSKLQTLASRLRQYRLYSRGGRLPAASLDRPQMQAVAVEIQAPEARTDSEDENDFLQFYHQQILTCLDRALEQVTNDRFAYLQRKNIQTAQHFLIALQLFHCRGQSMAEIAPQVGLQAQFQVTRLLKLKEFRANVRSRLLKLLLERILDKAKTYTDSTQLQTLNQQIEAVLNEQVSTLLQQAEAEAAVAKQRPLTSLFACRLCHYLDTRDIRS